VEEDREEEDVPDPLIFCLHQRRRVGSRAASDGGALEHAPPAFLRTNSCSFSGSLANFWSFEDCFVKFGLFDVIFIYFLNIVICIVDVKRGEKEKRRKIKKKKKKKKKKKIYNKKCVFVLVFFIML